MSQRNPTYRYDDEYVTDGEPSRPPTSQRRYQPQNRQNHPVEQAAQRIQQRHDQPQTQVRTRRLRADVDTRDYTEYLPADQNEYADEYEDAPRPRYNPATQRLPIQRASRPGQRITGDGERAYYDDQSVRYRDTEPQLAVPPTQTRGPLLTRRRLFGLAGLVGAYGAGAWVNTNAAHAKNLLEEGNLAATPLSLVCGHHDSEANQTELYAFVRTSGCLSFIEYPGGSQTNANIINTKSVREMGYHGDLTDIYLKLFEQQILGKYQIRLHLETTSTNPFVGSFQTDLIFVDKGRKIFEPAELIK